MQLHSRQTHERKKCKDSKIALVWEGKKIKKHFERLSDFRQPGKVDYNLSEIVITTICAVISGCEYWEEAFGIPAETYYDWKEKLENGFNFGIKAKGERRRKIDKIALEQAVKENPDAFLWELAEQFNCTAVAVFYAIKKLDITRKKRLSRIMKNPK